MFWNIFCDLCNKNNTKPTPVVKSLGIATGSVTKWKNGGIPNGDTLIKLADYLNCSVDYLLGRTNDPAIHYLNEKQFKLVARGGKNIDTTNKNTPTDKTPRTTKK